MNVPRTTYITSAHTLPNLPILILAMTVLGMSGMFMAIMLGAGILICMLALLAPMLLVMGFVAGKTEYALDETGLTKTVKPFFFKKPNVSSLKWNEVTGFKNGTDMGRGLRQYEYLEIYFKGFITWQINDQKGRDGFLKFKDEFLKAVEQYNHSSPMETTAFSPAYPNQPGAAAKTISSPVYPLIERKKTFYETVWAKVFFWMVLMFTIAVLIFLVFNPHYMSISAAFRILLVIIPGLVYLGWRIYRMPE